jgi:hypothetical protein
MYRYILILVVIFGIPLAYAKPSANAHSKSAANSNPNLAPVAADNTETQKSDESNTEHGPQDKERDAKENAFRIQQSQQNNSIVDATIVIAVFSGLGVFVTLGYAIVSFKQWRSMQKGLDITIEGIRPHLKVEAASRTLSPDDIIELEIYFTNSGSSPAEKVTIARTPTLFIGDRAVSVLRFNQPEPFSLERNAKETARIAFESPTADEVNGLQDFTDISPGRRLKAVFRIHGSYDGLSQEYRKRKKGKPYVFDVHLVYQFGGRWAKAEITQGH